MSVYKESCPDCRVCEKQVEERRPIHTVFVAGLLGICASVLVSGIGFCSLSVYDIIWNPESEMIAISWIALFVGAVLTMLGAFVPIAAYFTHIRPRHQIGFPTYAFLLKNWKTHRHLEIPVPQDEIERELSPTFNGSPILVLIEDRVGGWKREVTCLVGGDIFALMTSWFGHNVKLEYGDVELLVCHENALWFIAQGASLHGILRRAKERMELVEDLAILKLITNKDDPSNLGKSPHGQELNRRVSEILERMVPYLPDRDGLAMDAKMIFLHREADRRKLAEGETFDGENEGHQGMWSRERIKALVNDEDEEMFRFDTDEARDLMANYDTEDPPTSPS